jgi:hypothetical protein
MAMTGLTALTILLLGGCSNSGDDASSASKDVGPELKSSQGGAAAQTSPANPAVTTGGVDLAQARLPGAPREIVYSATVNVRVRNVEQALRAATLTTEHAGGALFKQRSELDRSPTISATYKVPPDRFTAVLDAIGKLGRVTDRRVGTADVTSRVVDLQARIGAARTSAERLRSLLEQSANVGDLLTVERELATREADVESLEGQFAALRARVDEATISVQFTAPAAIARSTPHEPTNLPGFLTGLRTGSRAFRNTATVVGGAAGFALPFAAIVVILGAPTLVVRRRQRHAGA